VSTMKRAASHRIDYYYYSRHSRYGGVHGTVQYRRRYRFRRVRSRFGYRVEGFAIARLQALAAAALEEAPPAGIAFADATRCGRLFSGSCSASAYQKIGRKGASKLRSFETFNASLISHLSERVRTLLSTVAPSCRKQDKVS